jgi:hypothetical protein
MTTSKGHGMNEQPLTRDMAEVVESLRRTLEARAKKEVAFR